jgi:hypothetical protein
LVEELSIAILTDNVEAYVVSILLESHFEHTAHAKVVDNLFPLIALLGYPLVVGEVFVLLFTHHVCNWANAYFSIFRNPCHGARRTFEVLINASNKQYLEFSSRNEREGRETHGLRIDGECLLPLLDIARHRLILVFVDNCALHSNSVEACKVQRGGVGSFFRCHDERRTEEVSRHIWEHDLNGIFV